MGDQDRITPAILLKNYLEKSKLSQAAFARISGIALGTISGILRRDVVNTKTIEKLEIATDIDAEIWETANAKSRSHEKFKIKVPEVWPLCDKLEGQCDMRVLNNNIIKGYLVYQCSNLGRQKPCERGENE